MGVTQEILKLGVTLAAVGITQVTLSTVSITPAQNKLCRPIATKFQV